MRIPPSDEPATARAARVCVLGAPNAAELGALAETAPQAPVLVVVAPGAGSAADLGVEVVTADGGTPGALAAAAARGAGDDDVALVLAGTLLPDGWLDRLRAAAGAPLAGAALPLTLDEAPAGGVALGSTRDATPPRVPSSAAPVALVTRAALSVAGPPDPTLETWEETLTDLIQRLALAGMTAVVAADVAVRPVPGAAGGAALAERYPWLEALRDEAARPGSPAGRAAAAARRALAGLQVTLDLRSLGPVRMGTQTHALGLALALAATEAADLRFLVADDLDPEIGALLTAHPRTSLLPYDAALGGVARTAVVHRPNQVNTAHDLELLQPLGERVVITHQDLIAYRNPGYHATVDAWLQHRRATRFSLQLADRVLFFTRHARDDAVAEDLLDPAWADVVGLGVDEPPGPEPQRPAGLPAAADAGGLLLCLGADLRHKHRPFAIELLRALRDDHGWQGRLVLAGPHLPHGSTEAQEDAALAGDPRLAERVIRLGAVGAAEKRWLLERATLAVYPTLDEGFGLLPFEAAAAGTPCAFAASGALPEVLEGVETLLVPWDARRSAARVIGLLHDRAEADRHVAAVRGAARAHRWSATAERVLAAYERAVAEPRRGVSWEARDRATVTFDLDRLLPHLAGLEREIPPLRDFYVAVGEDGARLVGPHGLLGEDDRRALLSVVARPALRRPFLAALRLGYRFGRGG